MCSIICNVPTIMYCKYNVYVVYKLGFCTSYNLYKILYKL